MLESMGMVASRRRVGITIQPPEKWNVFDPRVIRWRLDSDDRAAQLVSLSELRRGFEPAAAALAARLSGDHSHDSAMSGTMSMPSSVPATCSIVRIPIRLARSRSWIIWPLTMSPAPATTSASRAHQTFGGNGRTWSGAVAV